MSRASAVRILDDPHRRSADGLPRARAGGTAADAASTPPNELERDHEVVRARTTLGERRAGGRREAPAQGTCRTPAIPCTGRTYRRPAITTRLVTSDGAPHSVCGLDRRPRLVSRRRRRVDARRAELAEAARLPRAGLRAVHAGQHACRDARREQA